MISRILLRAAATCGAVLAASGMLAPAIAQQVPPDFQIDESGWRGGAQGDNETGQFTHCMIQRPYGNGVTLALLMSPRYELNIGLANEAWNLLPEEGEEPEATEAEAEEDEDEEEEPVAEVNVDDVFVKPFPVLPFGDKVMMITTGVDEQLIDLLMRGNNLDVTVEQGTYRFPLTGTFNSITRLRGCIDTARRLAQEARAGGQPPGQAAMTGQVLVEILRGAGLEGAAVSPQNPSENPLAISFAWSLGELTGGVHQSPRTSGQIEIDKFTELYIDQFESTCTQSFQHAEEDSEVIRDRYALKLASMQCGDGAAGIYVSMFVALDDSHYTAFFHQGPIANRAQINDATDRIRQLIRQQAGG